MLNSMIKVKTAGRASTTASQDGYHLGRNVSVDVYKKSEEAEGRYLVVNNGGSIIGEPIKLTDRHLSQWNDIDENQEMKFAFDICGLKCALFSYSGEMPDGAEGEQWEADQMDSYQDYPDY